MIDEGYPKVNVTKTKEDGATEVEITSNTGPIATNDSVATDIQGNQNTGQINWLGSSYTGQDIKVVAHLYTPPVTDSAKFRSLQDDLDYWNALYDGAAGLSNTGLLTDIGENFTTFDERLTAVDGAIALGDSIGEQRARRKLRSVVLNRGHLNTGRGIARILIELQTLQESALTNRNAVAEQVNASYQQNQQGNDTITLGSLQTVSIQSHREKFGVRGLGFSYVKAYTRGPRTIAGSMIFTLFDEHPLTKLMRAMGEREAIWKDPEISTLLPDQIPPIDLTLVFANEYGSTSRLNIYGVEFINDSSTFSTENLLSEQVMNFVARDVDVMMKSKQIRLSRLQRGMTEDRDDSASSLLGTTEYFEFLDKLKLRRKLSNR